MKRDKHFDQELDELLKRIRKLRKQAEDNLASSSRKQSAGKNK